MVDSDRFSADDAIGVVEVDLAQLIDENTTADGELRRRRDPLSADSPGMKTQGMLEWSVRFCPLWQMPLEEMSRRMEKTRGTRKTEPDEVVTPWWMEFIGRFIEDKPEWEGERAKKRQETLAWFTGEKERDQMEAESRASEDLRSGILQVSVFGIPLPQTLKGLLLQFHIHQCTGMTFLAELSEVFLLMECTDLETESLEGTFSSDINHRKSAANGKPALADVIDRTPSENPDPPSAYCQVHLNDRMVYRTRTKQVTPLPYFNAVSERFIRDWTLAKIVFVVRDERDRENGEYPVPSWVQTVLNSLVDPILGMVSIDLRDAFADRSQFTR